MPATLGLIATHRKAGLWEFAQLLDDAVALSFLDRVTMELDSEVDNAFPKQWIGKVSVVTKDQRTLSSRVDEPKNDPGNTVSRDKLDVKARVLSLSGKAIDDRELDVLMERLWTVSATDKIGRLLQ